MKIIAKGPFEVQMLPLGTVIQATGGNQLMRKHLKKTYSGKLAGRGEGEFLGVATATSQGQAYSAFEEVIGTLNGREGSFILQHFAGNDGSGEQFFLTVVTGSGTGELEGLKGTVGIDVEAGQHYYTLDLELPE